MIKNIPYTTYATVPDDYRSPDGQLSASLNLINEDGALRPLTKPEILHSGFAPDERVFIHLLPDGSQNYICYNPSTKILYWLSSDFTATNKSVITSVDSLYNLSFLGNTAVIATDKGICYVLWKENSYSLLGSKPPFISIEFGLFKLNSPTDEREIKIKVDASDYGTVAGSLTGAAGSGASRPHNYVGTDSSASDLFMEELSNAVYANLYSAYNDAVSQNGLCFYQPFMIRYAFRLYDGSHYWHSAPVLMLPTSIIPLLRAYGGKYEDGIYTIKTSAQDFRICELRYRILDTAGLQEWRDIITGIDIFISAPLYTYDQSKRVMGIGHINYSTSSRRGRENSASETTLRLDGIFQESEVTKSTYHQAPHNNTTSQYWVLPTRDSELADDIKKCHEFYRVARIEFEDIKLMSQLEKLLLEDGLTSSNLLTQQTLKDDFQSHHSLVPHVLQSYNNRFSLAGLSIQLFGGYPIRSAMCFSNPSGFSAANTASVSMRVVYQKDGKTLVASDYHANSFVELSKYSVDSFLNYPPRFLYIPDPDAKQLEIVIHPQAGEAKKIILPLTPHDFLNGAYYFRDFEISINGDDPLPETVELGNADYELPTIQRGNLIYTSEVNNPFIFNAASVATVGSRAVLALSTAAKALSQGQFGQFPLYAFTDQGVWALEVSSTGVYSARQPITRDVCINPESVTQIDSAVLFATDRGIMLLTGSQTQCISETIDAPFPFDLSSLPSLDNLQESHILGRPPLSVAPFNSFIAGASMLYDYPHQRIIVFNPSSDYAYVYSLKSKAWGMMHSDILRPVNSYPDALAITTDGDLASFSATTDGEDNQSDPFCYQLLVTRPLTLDAPDTLKTVTTVLQRGTFAHSNIKSILYGSRDLISWHLVRSSTNHRLSGFSGTPYKYFRIALICNLSPSENIVAASVQFRPRLTNKLR